MATTGSLLVVPPMCRTTCSSRERRASGSKLCWEGSHTFPMIYSSSTRFHAQSSFSAGRSKRVLQDINVGPSDCYDKKTCHWKPKNNLYWHSEVAQSGPTRCIPSSRSRIPSHCSIRTPNVFADKSFLQSGYPVNFSSARNHVPLTSMDCQKAHAANTIFPDAVMGIQELDGLGLDSEKRRYSNILCSHLPSHPKLYRGALGNGLRYLILPNKVPPDRFEAHLEIHTGSVDEEEDEQGIAHMIEHVAFLGSRKREALLGTGARSNAYTDFHHTVFHFHSPVTAKDDNEELFPHVLEALNEIAFSPEFLSSRVEKERRAILSELQMMNTIEYRVDCQLLQHLHSENKLGRRFPIGLEEQIKKWNIDKIRKFHERWYYPANATLYIVGDISNIPNVVNYIEGIFGQVGLESDSSSFTTSGFSAMTNSLVPRMSVVPSRNNSDSATTTCQSQALNNGLCTSQPVKHNWSLPGTTMTMKEPQIFQHELLQNFSISMFCKVPVKSVRTFGDLREVLMKKIILSALHFRINTRYKSSNPPFTAIELDHSDSGREGCTVTTLTITAEPRNWEDAVRVAVREVRRLKQFGVTKGELIRYMDALLKDSEHLAAMMDNVPSVDNLDFIMESDALGHCFMDQRQTHESWVSIASTVTLDEVNAVGAQMLAYISDFGNPGAPVPAAIVACIPEKVHTDGNWESIFTLSSNQIIDAIRNGLADEVEAEKEIEVPDDLISPSELDSLQLSRAPSFVPLNPTVDAKKYHDEESGITQRRLSNGISVNYKVSKSESKGCIMRIMVGGGRAVESSNFGAVAVGVRTLSEGGRVGKFTREQVELFCVNHLINCSLEASEEFIYLDFRFTLRNNGLRAAFQLLHMVLEHSVWTEDAFERAKKLHVSHYHSISKSLERATAHKVTTAMLNGDERFVEPTPQSLQSLSLESVKDAVMNQLVSGNMEVNIVGDFSEMEIESCILDYLGTVRPNCAKEEEFNRVAIMQAPSSLQHQQVFLRDTDERACACIAGATPNRWGFTFDGKDLLRNDVLALQDAQPSLVARFFERENIQEDVKRRHRSHPLFYGVSLSLLAEIINSRLFTTVRDSLGLTYDVSFELHLFDILKLGWYVVSVTSTPAKVHKAVDACVAVLRELHVDRITERELKRAKRTLLMKHEAEIKSNAYWLGLLANLQSSLVPRKDISCIKDITSLYEGSTIEDVYLAYEQLNVDENSIFTCIGLAGPQTGNLPEIASNGEAVGDSHGVMPIGRGLTTMTRPTT